MSEQVAELERLGIGGLKVQSCRDGLARFVELACGSELGGEIDPGVDPSGGCLNGGTEVLDCRVGIAASVEQVAELPLRFGEVGLELDGLFELGLFAREIAGLVEGDGEIVLVVGVFGHLVDGLTILEDRFFKVTGVEVFVALPLGGSGLDEGFVGLFHPLIGLNLMLRSLAVGETAQSFGELKVHLRRRLSQGDGLEEFVPGLLPLALEDQGNAEIVMKVVVLGLECDSFFEMGAGVGIAPVGPLDNAIEVKDLGVMRAPGEKLGTEWAGIVDVVAYDLGTVELELGVRIGGVVDEGLAEELDGIFKAVLAN